MCIWPWNTTAKNMDYFYPHHHHYPWESAGSNAIKSITTTVFQCETPWGKILTSMGSRWLSVCPFSIYGKKCLQALSNLCSQPNQGHVADSAVQQQKHWDDKTVVQQRSMKSTNRAAQTNQRLGCWSRGKWRVSSGTPALRLSFSENETKWQETINLHLQLSLHPLPPSRKSQMSPPERMDLRVRPDENLCVYMHLTNLIIVGSPV